LTWVPPQNDARKRLASFSRLEAQGPSESPARFRNASKIHTVSRAQQ
jgi:hypothetical protein